MNDPSNPISDASEPRGEIEYKVFGRTDVGQVREHNEDNFLIADLTRRSRGLREEDRCREVGINGNVFAVCDGMGGAAAGEVASQLAVDLIFEQLLQASAPQSSDELARNLVAAVEYAGHQIYTEARADRSRRGMGTTATVAVLRDARLFIAQVGDSRGYVQRQGRLAQVTRDQSLVNQLIEAGQLTEEEAETFEHNNIILQALGTAETVQVDLTYVDLRQGDTLLLCSDGLSGMIRDAEIRQVLVDIDDPIRACKELTDRANAAGGHDNITVIVVRFSGPGLPPPSDSDESVAYRKYPLPVVESSATSTPVPMSVPTTEPAPPSDEVANEARPLRVGHTRFEPAQPQDFPRNPSYGRSARDEPVDLPTTGLAPQVVGAIVIFSLIVLAAVGIFLLR